MFASEVSCLAPPLSSFHADQDDLEFIIYLRLGLNLSQSFALGLQSADMARVPER